MKNRIHRMKNRFHGLTNKNSLKNNIHSGTNKIHTMKITLPKSGQKKNYLAKIVIKGRVAQKSRGSIFYNP